MSHRSLRSSRTLSEDGRTRYQESFDRHIGKLRSAKRDVDSLLMSLDEDPVLTLGDAQLVRSEINRYLSKYLAVSTDFVKFLESQRTEEASREIPSQKLSSRTLEGKVRLALTQIDSVFPSSDKNSHRETGSQTSQRSQRTYRTNSFKGAQSELIRQKVKLETAKTKLKFAKEEAELLQREATLKADRNVMTLKRELEEAQSGLEAVKEALDFDLSDDLGGSYKPPSVLYNRKTDNAEEATSLPPSTQDDIDKNIQNSDTSVLPEKPQGRKSASPHRSPSQRTIDFVRDQQDRCADDGDLNPLSAPFVPKTPHIKDNPMSASSSLEASHLDNYRLPISTTPEVSPSDNLSAAKEIAKYVVKRDLLSARLTIYDDQPGHYMSWKLSFQHVMKELDTTPLEQLDLLTKYLGPTSKQQAMNIRSSNANFPAIAVRKIWDRLDSRYGTPETIESSIQTKLNTFPKLTNHNRKELFDLHDMAAEVKAMMEDDKLYTAFAYFNSSIGVNRFVSKLPYGIQEKWATSANAYKINHMVTYPPFSYFVTFLDNTAKIRNDPGFIFENLDSKLNTDKTTKESKRTTNRFVSSMKTEVLQTQNNSSNSKVREDLSEDTCPLHGTPHKLNACRAFRLKPISERVEFLKQKGLCFKCCGTKKHFRDKCSAKVKCSVCSSSDHPSALHLDASQPQKSHEGERLKDQVNTSCTEICDTRTNTSKSCAKIILVNVHHKDSPTNVRSMYCLIDDQSNRTLATSNFFNHFGENSLETEYVLSSCAGKVVTSGRRASGYVVSSADHTFQLDLPSIIECNEIPNNREEIPSPHIAKQFNHLKDIASYIPHIDSNSDIELLIGRDLIAAHHVLEHRIGNQRLPYAQRLPLGWVIIGNVCLGNLHEPEEVIVNKTFIHHDGRPTIMPPCENQLSVHPVFAKTQLDEKPGLSVEDSTFLEVMSTGFQRQDDGHWMAPLPFKPTRPTLANNRELAEKRARSFDHSLKLNPVKRQHVHDFMQKLIDNRHAEEASPIDPLEEQWYLPMFSVYHPKKPDSVRVVFDASAKYQGLSLNDVLLKGPDIYNSLLGILLRFRKESYAVTVDIEQMFHNFRVTNDHRRYLRFLWHEDNQFEKALVDYQMSVHVFGNSPSPAVATYGLRKTVESAETDVRDFVCNDFYVDDGLTSCPTEHVLIDLVRRTKQTLAENGQLKLHKVVSNSRTVLQAFDTEVLAKNLKNLDFGSSDLPMQRSLGLLWDKELDNFTFCVSSDIKPYTRRGVLSTINSLYDPLGLAAPVIVRGKLLMRDMLSSVNIDWDDPLPERVKTEWDSWVHSVKHLESLQLPRAYNGSSFSGSVKREVHVFGDASKDAIAAVAYLKLFDSTSSYVSFLIGKAKVAPLHGHTIPRLELCASVLAVELSDIVREHLKIDQKDFYYYTDSRVVLGYLTNETRRFYVYVGNRVSRIRASSSPTQWFYVPSDQNPADIATRSIDSIDLPNSAWINGPNILVNDITPAEPSHVLIDPERDEEIRPLVECCKTETDVSVNQQSLGSQRFDRFSQWSRIVRSISFLKSVIRRKMCRTVDTNLATESETLIIRSVQEDVYSAEIKLLKNGKSVPHTSSLSALNPVLDSDGIIRVGGRLKHAPSTDTFDLCNHPIILPKGNHVSALIVLHFHQKIHHQGRHLTEGAVRAGEFWIVGAKRLISSLLRNCLTCRKLRGKLEIQQMADLPVDRLTPSPPFSYVGVDTFGPWSVTFRRTRGGCANQKRWALLFTCLATRAVHIHCRSDRRTFNLFLYKCFKACDSRERTHSPVSFRPWN